MVESSDPEWLVLDGYEDEPAAFGVPPYVGFHIRYVCGVLESKRLPYTYITIDQWRQWQRTEPETIEALLSNALGVVCIAGAVVPGKYLRGTPISLKETQRSSDNFRPEPQRCSEVGPFVGGVNKDGRHYDQTSSSRSKIRTPP